MSRRLSKSAASCSAAICAMASVLNAPAGLPKNNSANRSAATEKTRAVVRIWPSATPLCD